MCTTVACKCAHAQPTQTHAHMQYVYLEIGWQHAAIAVEELVPQVARGFHHVFVLGREMGLQADQRSALELAQMAVLGLGHPAHLLRGGQTE